jgi:reactive intermediate/imine deaminase
MDGTDRIRLTGTDKVAKTDGTWAQLTRKDKLVFVSGQVPLDATGELVGRSDFRRQAVQALDNLVSILESAGASLKDLMAITVFVTDMANRPVFAEVRDSYFRDNPPASTIVQVTSLFSPEVMVEVNGIAMLD